MKMIDELDHDRIVHSESVICKLLDNTSDVAMKGALYDAYLSLERQREMKVNQVGYVGHCPKCGHLVVYGTKYCKECGQHISGWAS